MRLMDILPVIISVTLLCPCWSIGLYTLTARILDRGFNRRTCLQYSLAFYSIQLPMNLLLYYGVIPYNILFWDIGLLGAQLLIFVVFMYRADHERPAKTFSAAALSHFILYTCQSVFERTAYRLISYEADAGFFAFNLRYSILPHILMLLAGILTAYVLKRVRFSACFSYLFSSGGKAALTFAACLLLMNSYALLAWFFPEFAQSVIYAASALAVILCALFLLQFIAVFALNREKVRTQEETIRQQQAHLRLLEELQIELRSFRHDFQNLLSGAALQAREGDLAGIRDFLQNTAGYFDQKLGGEIRQISVLDNVKIYSLRSLLTIKLAAMRERGVDAGLEILRPVTRCAMKEEDLLRCVGILVDNAVEAAAGYEGGRVRIILLQEQRELRIAISNSCRVKPDLSAMQLPHHTTKGTGRGTGLSGYRRILGGYPGCVSRTLWADGLLTQELRVGEE